jgi:hypothetical protein
VPVPGTRTVTSVTEFFKSYVPPSRAPVHTETRLGVRGREGMLSFLVGEIEDPHVVGFVARIVAEPFNLGPALLDSDGLPVGVMLDSNVLPFASCLRDDMLRCYADHDTDIRDRPTAIKAGYYLSNLAWERCPSGLRGTLGKRVKGLPFRGFESRPLRYFQEGLGKFCEFRGLQEFLDR